MVACCTSQTQCRCCVSNHVHCCTAKSARYQPCECPSHTGSLDYFRSCGSPEDQTGNRPEPGRRLYCKMPVWCKIQLENVLGGCALQCPICPATKTGSHERLKSSFDGCRVTRTLCARKRSREIGEVRSRCPKIGIHDYFACHGRSNDLRIKQQHRLCWYCSAMHAHWSCG